MGDDFLQRLKLIEARNERVERDKAWETSWTRRGVISIITYLIVGFILMRLHAEGAWLDAFIPVCGYLLSTLSLPPIKAIWFRTQQSRNVRE